MKIRLDKIENWLWYLFLFLVPIGLRHIFNYNPVNFLEWQAIYIYASDIVFLALIGIWFFKNKTYNFHFTDLILLCFVAVAGLSVFKAINQTVALFQWLKLVEGVVLYLYVKNYAAVRFSIQQGFVAVVLSGLVQALIATFQFMLQHSLGLKYLGESVLAVRMTGIAAFIDQGQKIIRAYGTTPHPNILAAYLFVVLGGFYFISVYWPRKWLWHVGHAVILWGFMLTFSRTLIALWVLQFVIRAGMIRFGRFKSDYWDNQEMRRRCLMILGVTIIIGLLFASLYWPYVLNRASLSSQDEAVQLRVLYNQQAVSGGIKWLGIGMGNFVPWLMRQNIRIPLDQYQPVHNIYLLIYSEIGIVGLGLFIAFLISTVWMFLKRAKFHELYHLSFFLIVVCLLVSGLFDHTLWTSQTGRLLLWLSLGLLSSNFSLKLEQHGRKN